MGVRISLGSPNYNVKGIMLINTLDLEDKTIFHEINTLDNFNVFSVMDYSKNKMGVNHKINNGITSTLDFCEIDNNNILVGYVPYIVDRVVVKVISIDDTNMKTGPLFTLDEKTQTNKISVIKLSNNIFVVCYNDITNKCLKAIAISVNGESISTISNTILLKGFIPEVRSVKINDNEMVVFMQVDKVGLVQLIEYNSGKLIKKEEQVFYTGSYLYNLSICSMKKHHVVGFLNNAHMLVLKILEVDPKVKFTQGMQFNKRINNDFFQLISIDKEMVLCYFNGIVQIISLNNGQIIQPESI